jgi:hypothetical protein
MSSWRFLLIIPASCLIGALTWLQWPQIVSTAQAARPAAESAGLRDPKELPEAVQLLHAAVDRIHSPKASCLETKIWQRASVGEVVYEADGKFQSAPRGRTRLDLETRTANAVSRLRLISDGTRILRATSLNDSTWSNVGFVDAWTVVERSQGKLSIEDVRRTFLQGRLGGGPADLLQNALDLYSWTKKAKVNRGGSIYYKLTGKCKSPPANTPDMKVALSECRLYLNAENLWPHRVEWWGTAFGAAQPSLLFQVEFRDPVLTEAVPPEKLASEFTIDPHAYPIDDQTEKLATQLVH